VLRPQRAVYPLQERAGSIVIAVVYEGVISHIAGIAEEVGGLRVFCREIVLVYDSAAVHVMQKIGFQVIHDPLRHRCICCSREQPKTAVLEARCRIDQPLCGVSIGDADKVGHVRGARSEATERDAAAHGGRGSLISLSTVIRSAGNDADAFQDRRERDLKLQGHVTASGKARYGTLRNVDIEGRERLGSLCERAREGDSHGQQHWCTPPPPTEEFKRAYHTSEYRKRAHSPPVLESRVVYPFTRCH
jgi:hypothetical protein